MRRFARLARFKMITPTSLLRTSIALLGAMAVLVLVGGCRKPKTSFYPDTPSTPVAKQRHPAPRPTVNQRQEAVTTVTTYLQALDDGKYSAAYELLSRDSKKLHNISDFEQRGKQGMPSFDLTGAKATVTGTTALVTVPFYEEPNSAGIHLVREDDAWKILYRGGIPGMPYPDVPSGG